MITQTQPTYEELEKQLAHKDEVIANQKKELAHKDKIIAYAHKIVRNQRESYTSRVIDLESFFQAPNDVFEGKEVTLNVAYMRGVIGVGHDTMANHLAAKAQAGGIEYNCETIKQVTEDGKTVYRNESKVRFLPENFNRTDTKAAEATLKQRESGKKRAEKRLEKLKQSLMVCSQCGESSEMHIGMVPICGACGHMGTLDENTDPDCIVKAEDVRVMVGDEVGEADGENVSSSSEYENTNSPEPMGASATVSVPQDTTHDLQEPPEFADIPFPDEFPLDDYESYVSVTPPASNGNGHKKPSSQKRKRVTI